MMFVAGRGACRAARPAWRLFSATGDGGDGGEPPAVVEEEAAAPVEEAPKWKPPAGYDPHKPPDIAAWNLSCHTWQTIDRDATLLSNWHNPDDPENFSRITITESSFTDYHRMNLARMHDNVRVCGVV